MTLADTILTAISTIAALVTVLLAYLALGKAQETLAEAKAARLDAERVAKDAAFERRAAAQDRRQAAVDRREAEYDRDRRRLERVGEIVEDLFWAASIAQQGGKVAADNWMSQRNLLRHALVGLHSRLPVAASILNYAAGNQAVGAASQARSEIEKELSKLAAEHLPAAASAETRATSE